MYFELQSEIDDLAARLDAPAVLEDAKQRMVVHSAHSHPIDDVRRDSILRRETVPQVVEWFRQFGIHDAAGPLRIASHPDLGILGRLCVPVRIHGRLMGFLWLIDDRRRLGDDAVADVQQAAGRVALLLYEEELTQRLTRRELGHLLSRSEELRAASAQEIVVQGLFPARTPIVVVVLQPLGLEGVEAHECVSEALSDVGRDTRHGAEALRLPLGDHGVLLVPAGEAHGEDAAAGLAGQARASLARRVTRRAAAGRAVAAVGEVQPRLVRAVVSYRQARLAAKVAAAIPSLGDVPRWRTLGVFRALAQLPSDEAAESALDPRLRQLFDTGDHEVVRTLETYLDLGCDAKATAERLHLHRATLYYRLDKVERLTGLSLRSGDDRLAVHLSFKLSRFAGLHPDLAGQAG